MSIEMKTDRKGDPKTSSKLDEMDNKAADATSIFSRFRGHCMKMLHFQSIRDVQHGVQMATCFVIAALIAYKSASSKKIAIPYILALLSPMMIADTLAGSILTA